MNLAELFKACASDAGVTTPEAVTPDHEFQFNAALKLVMNRLWSHAITRNMATGWPRPTAGFWTSEDIVIPQALRPDSVLMPLLRADLKKTSSLWRQSTALPVAQASETLLTSLEKSLPMAPPAPDVVHVEIP